MKLFQQQVSFVFSKRVFLLIDFFQTQLPLSCDAFANSYSIVSVIEVTFSGKAFVQWTEGSGENSTTYTGKQKLFKHKAPVTGFIYFCFILCLSLHFLTDLKFPC